MAFKIETSNQDTTFWYEFIELYRNIPILWSDAHENKPKHLRDRALNILLRKYRERDAAAGVREIKQLLKDFRLAYRTELKLALEHTYATGNSLSNYRSALWYFEALSFLESKELRTLKLHSGLTGDNSGIVIDTSFSTIDDSFSCINNYDDEIVLYCKSLVPALKRLPPQQLMYAKYHIDNVVKWGRSGILTYDRPHIDADGSKKSSGAVNVENCTEVLTTQNDISVPPKRLKVDQHNSDDANHATTSLAYDMCKHISMPSEECLVVIDVSENDIEQLKLASVDNEFDHLSFETSSPTYARPDGISDSDRIIHLEISHSNLEDGADPHEMADPHETTLKNAEPVLELTLRRQCTMHFSHYIRNVVPKYSDEEFLRQFRIGRKAVQMICNHLETTSAYKKLRGHGGYEAISPQTHVLSFLWFLGHDKTSYRDVATQFNLSVSCLHSVICRVADAILSMKHILMIPLSEARKTASDIAFSKKCNFSGVIGCVGGTQIKIDKPRETPERYLLTKGHYSIQLQAIIDENLRFVDVFVEYPDEPELLETVKRICGNRYCLLGNASYPCMNQLLVPYPVDEVLLTQAQKTYNDHLQTVTSQCNQIFAHLKTRFRRLHHLKGRHLSRMVDLIKVCCILHNLASVAELKHLEGDMNQLPPEPIFTYISETRAHVDIVHGQQKRDKICAKYQ